MTDVPTEPTAAAAGDTKKTDLVDEEPTLEPELTEPQNEQQQQQPPPPAIFIHNLTVLSPRQKLNEVPTAKEVLSVALPPLRPEEPVASIRGALTEVLGFAHLTRYRLVIEKKASKSNDRRGSGGSNSAKVNGAKVTTTKQAKGSDAPWSPFTLKEALITTSPSFKSLETGAALPPKKEEKNEGENEGEEEEEEEEEVVLDEFGDLSILLSLLEDQMEQHEETVDAEAADTATEKTSNEAEAADLVEKKMTLDASHLAIRVVLERYDLASIRDHVTRVRQLLEGGNVPCLTTLIGEENVENENENEKGENGEVIDDGESADKAKESSKTNDDEATQTKKETKEEKRLRLETLAKNLPSFTSPDSSTAVGDVEFEHSTRGGNLTNFYYLACGEEQTLRELQKKEEGTLEGGEYKNGSGAGVGGGGSGRKMSSDSWMEMAAAAEQKENKKKGGGNRKNKKGGSKNNSGSGDNKSKASSNGAATKSDTSSTVTSAVDNLIQKISNQQSNNYSIVEIEHVLYNLNETTYIATPVQLSGYHPPPPHRRVLGDLAYLQATMPDGQIVHVTAFPLGFYVNRSTLQKFDPTPISSSNNNVGNGVKDACYSHSLIDCLLQRSKSLRLAWNAALTASRARSNLLRATSHSEDALTNLFRPAVSPYWNNASCVVNNAAGSAYYGGASVLPQSSAPCRTYNARIDGLVARPTWLLPLPSKTCGETNGGEVVTSFTGPKQQTWHHDSLHKWNATRPEEEELTNVYGMDVRGGGLRDWNEELQTAREMGCDTFGERVERARVVHKVLSDFADAALAGVKAIFDGYIMAMNPHEPARSHVYLHNNIFFSRAVDSGLDTFKIIQGDAAAKKSASRDASNMGVLHRLDIPGLHTLATVLVEYLGSRIVCQSVVPGILHGEKSHSLLYGAVETLSALQCNEEMHKLLESSIGEGCMVATRTIPAHPLTDERMDVIKKYRITPLPEQESKEDIKEEKDGDSDENETKKGTKDGKDAVVGKDKSIQVCGPMEMKGILGSDKRKYVLDCTRLTPRDANWVSKTDGGTGRWEDHNASSKMGVKSTKLVPSSLDDDEWTVCVLRPELVTNYAEMKIGKYLKENVGAGKNKTDGKEEDKSETSPKDAKPSTAKEDETKEEEKEWVDVSKDKKQAAEGSNNKKESSKDSSHVAKVEEEYIRSLRYNVNVFLPFTRSIEIIDKDEHEKLKQDEEEARNLARHLWDTVIPNLTRDIRSSSGNGLQLPSDGRSLTDLIHQRGINCRYLGRLAELARKEELEDIISFERATAAASSAMIDSSREKSADAAKTTTKRAPRFRMPICWLELLECEMVARAAKHVLDSYMLEEGGSSTAQPAQTVASFLSAVVSVGEESAAETERRMTSSSIHKDVLDQEEMNALTLFGGGITAGSASSSPIRGREEIWSDIEREIGRRYRYTLSLYNAKDGDKSSRALYTPLLRRICQRSGIRLVAKQYNVGKKCVCGVGTGGNTTGLTTSYPIAPTDIVDILPLVKHAGSVSGESFAPCFFSGNNAAASSSPSLHVLLSDAKTMYEVGHANLNSGNFAVTLDYAQEASAMFQRVLDTPVHPQVAKCLKIVAVAHYQRDEHEQALSAAAKYLAVSISLNGFDSSDVLTAHHTIADFMLGTGKIPEGVKHLRAAQFLMEFMAGRNYAGLSRTYYLMGSHYYNAGKFEDALKLYELAASKRNEDRMFDCLIARNSAGVLAHLGQFKKAFDYEKKAYQLYVTFLGEDHDATKQCSNTLIQLMKLAVEQGKRTQIQENAREKETAADAVADQIRADEEAEEVKVSKKKKKQGGKKKGKK